MATESRDQALRNSPVVNKVAGYNAIAKPSDYVKGRDANGGFFKLRTAVRNDWINRGNGHTIVGPWTEADEAALRKKISHEDLPDNHPGPIAAVAATSAPLADEPAVTKTPDDTPPPAPKVGMDAATAKMLALRAELLAAGVKVQESWGMNRLQNEIDMLHKREAEEAELDAADAAAAKPKAAGGQATGVTAPVAKK